MLLVLPKQKKLIAIDLKVSATEYLRVLTTPVTTTPMSLACWANVRAVSGHLISVGVSTSANNNFSLLTLAGSQIAARARTASNGEAFTSTTVVPNVWFHGCAVFVSSTDRRAYLNGGGKGTNATSQAPSASDSIYIGARPAPDLHSDGKIAWPAVWNAALGDNQVLALGSGVSPLDVARNNLVAFWFNQYNPSLRDYFANFTLSIGTGAPNFVDGPILRDFYRRRSFSVIKAVAGVVVPVPSHDLTLDAGTVLTPPAAGSGSSVSGLTNVTDITSIT